MKIINFFIVCFLIVFASSCDDKERLKEFNAKPVNGFNLHYTSSKERAQFVFSYFKKWNCTNISFQNGGRWADTITAICP